MRRRTRPRRWPRIRLASWTWLRHRSGPTSWCVSMGGMIAQELALEHLPSASGSLQLHCTLRAPGRLRARAPVDVASRAGRRAAAGGVRASELLLELFARRHLTRRVGPLSEAIRVHRPQRTPIPSPSRVCSRQADACDHPRRPRIDYPGACAVRPLVSVADDGTSSVPPHFSRAIASAHLTAPRSARIPNAGPRLFLGTPRRLQHDVSLRLPAPLSRTSRA
jgi:hypothetical protein